MFCTYLRKSAVAQIIKSDHVHLRMDATYFKRFYLLCYQDHEDGDTQLIRFSNGEHFEEIKDDLDNLIKLGVQIESITTDGRWHLSGASEFQGMFQANGCLLELLEPLINYFAIVTGWLCA